MKSKRTLINICLLCCALLPTVAQAASSGSASGGNTLTITGTALGNGSDITNVTICEVVAAIQSQTATSVTVVTGRAEDGGTGDIMVYSASLGVTAFTNGYTYNPPGAIFGSFMGWSSVSNLPVSLEYLAAASADGNIYAIGGESSLGNYQSTVYVYDPSQPTKGWISVSSLPAAREALAAAKVNGKIYAIGGLNGGSHQSTVYVYEPSQPALGWLSVGSLPVMCAGLAAATVNGKIYAIGGESSFGNYQSTVYVYDPSQPGLGWLSVSNLPTALVGLAAASVNGKIYAIGGYGSGFQSKVYVYDPAQPALGWLSVSNLPVAREYLSATTVDGRIYVVGGNDGTNIQSTVYEGSFSTGIVPSSGPLAGDNTVTISGNNLGKGDVTSVTLCVFPRLSLWTTAPPRSSSVSGRQPW